MTISQFNIVVLIIALISTLSFAIISNYDYDGIVLINAQTIDSDDTSNNTISSN